MELRNNYFLFVSSIVKAKIIVNNAVIVPDTAGINHIPCNPHCSVNTKRNIIGNTKVPNPDVIKERIGRSNAVK